MEDEIICVVCKKPFVHPIILPCAHNICLNCAKTSVSFPDFRNDVLDDNGYMTVHDAKQLYQMSKVSFLNCPRCKQTVYLDNRGISVFPRNKILERLVDSVCRNQNTEIIECQLCEKRPPSQATVMCEQCEVYYCSPCVKMCHPNRGPLAKHVLVPPSPTASAKPAVKCGEHREENLSMYCVLCRMSVCYLCVDKGRHHGHEVKAIGAMYKEVKNELAMNLNVLCEKNMELQNFIKTLCENCSQIQENGLDFEASIVAQCDSLVDIIQQRKTDLIEAIASEINRKAHTLKKQITDCEEKIKGTKGLLTYTMEVLRETEPSNFLVVANSLNTRVVHVTDQWNSNVSTEPVTGYDLDLTLDTATAHQALQDLHFIQLKAPLAPEILPEQCTVSNNEITLVWEPRKYSSADLYVVEVDDGKGGKLKEMYRGSDKQCTIKSLQFDSTYRARVRGINQAGEGPLSDEVYLTTSDVAWFQLDPNLSHGDIVISNEQQTVTCASHDDRVVLGNIGFVRGCHYWEVSIDRYDGNPDPAVGIARLDTLKDSILGKDSKAWCMYIDNSRSWFRHNNEHSNRREGGVEVGSIIGLLLDLGEHKITFYLNDEVRGTMRLPPDGDFYPAFSLNRNVQITVHTGLEIPEIGSPE